jgi:putative ABC transport system substrate-binding protein
MNPFIYFYFTLILLSFTALGAGPKICLTQMISHASLNLMAQGVIDELKEHLKEVEIIAYNAQGDMSLAVQIARTCLSQNPDVIIALSTPSAQAVVRTRKQGKTPVVFGGITDPIGAGLISSLEKAHEGISGTIDAPNPKDQLAFFQSLQPSLKKLCALYNPGEENSTLQIQALQGAAQEVQMTVHPQAITKLSDIKATMHTNQNPCDAFYVPNDNLVVSGIETVLKVSKHLGKPLYVSDPESVKKGARAAVANDPYKVGRETGKIALGFLKGEKLIPVVAVKAPLKVTPQLKAIPKRSKGTLPPGGSQDLS